MLIAAVLIGVLSAGLAISYYWNVRFSKYIVTQEKAKKLYEEAIIAMWAKLKELDPTMEKLQTNLLDLNKTTKKEDLN